MIATIGDASPKDFARNQRVGALIDLELGDKAKWVLVYRDEKGKSFFVAPEDRVRPREASAVLVSMGEHIAELLKKAGK